MSSSIDTAKVSSVSEVLNSQKAMSASVEVNTIGIVGLGYVGLPLAIALAKHYEVTGFDINESRVLELLTGQDRTNEISEDALKTSKLRVTSNLSILQKQDVYIVTVPTPVTEDNKPDLTPLQKASESVGKVLSKGAIVVYESTVYPGVTEEFCGPILEKVSGLKVGRDFYLGYSPERINPGDKLHTVDKITKVVSGQTPEIANTLKTIYGKMNQDNIFVAKNIKTAEAAKVIENAQRDINIAFVNEIATIVGKMGLSIYDVLEAAETKWNFLKFKPGLVGGHCIGVDPYYLAHCAQKLSHAPEVILAGRRTNENMGAFIAESIHEKLTKDNLSSLGRILILGVTFKEDIPDLRNTKVIDIIKVLSSKGYAVEVHDAFADNTDAKHHLGLSLLTSLENSDPYDCVVGAVSHEPYLKFSTKTFESLLRPKGLVADIKNMWRSIPLPAGIEYWSL